LYASTNAAGAIAETFGRFPEWTADRFVHQNGSPFALQAYRVDDARVTSLDDARTLVRENLRPSRVVTRDRKVTQAWSLRIFERHDADGIAWWSYYNPDWLSLGLWNIRDLKLLGDPETLTVVDARVREASRVLRRIIR
ncbi:MAG TPA: RES domain-containing protein, partial [Verrucomicrobiae bacterium]|nr:RES domain-containing protein [Verrucomicrobiae bacterium]